MRVKFLWGDGRLDYGTTNLNHVNLVQRTGRPHPADFIGGTYDFQTGAFTDTYGTGVHPDERELRFMLEQDLMQYEDQLKIVNYAATVEDTEPEFNLSFLEDPHSELYECAWENDKMKPKAKEAIKNHVMNPLHKAGYNDADEWIFFTVFGSGASYNWDEEGDFDVQMWVDIDKYNASHDEPKTADDLVKEVRTIVQTVNFPSFADLELETPDCEGKMLIQFYPQPGTGSKDENLAKKPYACYDMENDEWYQSPKPYDADFYGTHFLAIQTKANDIAVQAEGLITELQRNVLNFQFWSGLWNKYKSEDYEDSASKSQDAAELQKEGIATLFEGIFGGRVEAYSPGGEGIEDERDAIQKLLEVWGIFQKLKHYARAPLPWDEQELPEEPKESAWKEAAEGFDDLSAGSSFGYINGHLIIGQNHHQAIMAELIKKGWTWEQLMEAKQAWGWFYPPHPPYQPEVRVRFTSDAGTQDPEVFQDVLDKFTKLYGVKAIQYFGTVKGIGDSGKEYGQGLSGKDNINQYLPGGVYQDYSQILKQTPIPDPPNMNMPGGTNELQLFDHPVPGGGNPPPKKSATVKLGDWNDLMDKARRLRNDQQVQITVNQPDHVVGTVQGDHGTYQTEIWRDDPSSQAITMWDCECPWSQYSWGRTRQWKKYEGRPCAHTLALFWAAQAQPPAGADQQQPAPEQTPPVPAPMGQMAPQQGLITPVPIPNVTLPLAPGQGILPPGGPLTQPVGPPQPQGPPAYSVPTTPQNAQGVVKIPGALSHVAAAYGDYKFVWGDGELIVWNAEEDFHHFNARQALKSVENICGGFYNSQTDQLSVDPHFRFGNIPDDEALRQMIKRDIAMKSQLKTAASQIVDIKRGDPFYNYQGKTFYFDPYFDNKKRKGLNYLLDDEVVGSITWTVHTDHVYLESAYVDPGLRGSGIFNQMMEIVHERYPGLHVAGNWNPTSPLNEFADSYNYRVGATVFENGTHVRNKYDVIGEDTVTSIKYTVPQNSAGTVLYSDSTETVAIFPLKGGELTPHLVKVEGLTYEFYADQKVNPFIRRRN